MFSALFGVLLMTLICWILVAGVARVVLGP